MSIAIALVVLAVGSVIFHFMSPWWWTPIASNWGFIDTTIIITFWVTGIAYVAILCFLAYCAYRYRGRKGNKAEYKPEDSKLEWQLTIVTSIGVAIMLAPGLWAWNEFVTVPEGADEVEILGKQWSWAYRFPGEDGKLGTSDSKFINDDNPFGLNPKDPNGKDDVLIDDNELHLPLDRPVKVLLRSIDVLHDFYVPQFRAKMDIVPGMITYFWLTPTRTGTFDVLCAELCGVGHYTMRGSVVVEEEAVFKAWLGEKPTFAQSMADAGKGAKETKNRILSEAETETTGKELTR